MRWFFAILFILMGSFLFALTINELGDIGNVMMKITGLFLFYVAGLIVRKKKEKH
ncbi:hypothetical protein [Bacillus sp. B1-b2]|uniref:hypothetical protein n=1 Tax=Bacillus sp. B1-b2 TaxID=2653201 RepID=UPI00186A59EB|nr:hypothetical protein [Bacillus sp. B1-b2]